MPYKVFQKDITLFIDRLDALSHCFGKFDKTVEI